MTGREQSQMNICTDFHTQQQHITKHETGGMMKNGKGKWEWNMVWMYEK